MKSKISSFWNRLSKDVQGSLDGRRSTRRSSPGLQSRRLSEPTLDEIIDA